MPGMQQETWRISHQGKNIIGSFLEVVHRSNEIVRTNGWKADHEAMELGMEKLKGCEKFKVEPL